MKPKNKLQKQILKLSHTLSPLSDYQRQEAIRKVAPHIAKYNSKKEYVCLDCGHSWTDEKTKKVVCPHCSIKLEVDTSRKRNYCEKYYFAVVTTCQGFQVIRMFFMQVNLRRGQSATYWIEEAFQKWFSPGGKLTIVGRARHWLNYYSDIWDWGSEMEVRSENAGHYVTPYDVVGHSSVLPEIKRNGYNGNYHRCSPYTLFTKLLSDNRVETAWKVGYYQLVRHSFGSPHQFEKYWSSVKIAIRHKYRITDPTLWYDLLDALEYCGKDTLNPKYICPNKLKQEHDFWMAKKQAKIDKENRERERERLMTEEQRYLANLNKVVKDEAEYKEAKSKFFDLEFCDKEIVIKPLVSVREFVEEGHSLCHCVFTGGYYKRPDVLILHALVNDTSIATIELSLRNYVIIQCRGKYNKIPPMYDRIMSLLQKNIPQIMSKSA